MSRDDNFWFGVLVVVIFVALCIVGGYLIVRFQNWRLSLHWRPLLPLFDAVSIASGGGGGPGGLLRGKHRGRSFAAAIAPGVTADSDGDDRFNEFTLALLEVPGSHDWCVVQRSGGFSGGARPSGTSNRGHLRSRMSCAQRAWWRRHSHSAARTTRWQRRGRCSPTTARPRN